jgi:hypothetical protein
MIQALKLLIYISIADSRFATKNKNVAVSFHIFLSLYTSKAMAYYLLVPGKFKTSRLGILGPFLHGILLFFLLKLWLDKGLFRDIGQQGKATLLFFFNRRLFRRALGLVLLLDFGIW